MAVVQWLARHNLSLILIFGQIATFLCGDYPAPISQVPIELDSNIDTNENMDKITYMLYADNGHKTSQDNSNELNLEEVEREEGGEGKVLSDGGKINKNLGGKKASSKYAILTYSLKGTNKKKKKKSHFKELKSNRHHLDNVINSGAFPMDLINQVEGLIVNDKKCDDTLKAYQPTTTTTTRSTTLNAAAEFSMALFKMSTSTFDTSAPSSETSTSSFHTSTSTFDTNNPYFKTSTLTSDKSGPTFDTTTSSVHTTTSTSSAATQSTTSSNKKYTPPTRYKYTMGVQPPPDPHNFFISRDHLRGPDPWGPGGEFYLNKKKHQGKDYSHSGHRAKGPNYVPKFKGKVHKKKRKE